ncbi:MAG: hypothetical protein WCA39_15635 [Nitrososphaeraceae archaeon]
MYLESIEVPLGQPISDLRPSNIRFGDTSMLSSEAPTMISFPLTDKPPNTSLIAFPLGAVARMTLTPSAPSTDTPF